MRIGSLICLCMLVSFSLSAKADASKYNEAEQDSITSDLNLVLSISGSHSMPRKLFSDNYESALGWTAEVGVSVSHYDTLLGLCLTFSRDYFTLSNSIAESHGMDESVDAVATGVMLGIYGSAPMFSVKGISVAPMLGGGFGACRFSLADEDFESLGNSTFTELQSESGNTQFCDYYRFGLMMHGFGPASLQYDYHLMSVQRTWK